MALNENAEKILAERGIEQATETIAEKLTPVVLKLKSIGAIESRDEGLSAMPDEKAQAFLDDVARGINPTGMDAVKEKFRLLLPGGIINVTREHLEDGAYGGLVLIGAVGTREQQEYLASKLDAGTTAKLALKGLKLLKKFAKDPETMAIIETILTMAKAKEITMDTLQKLRNRVENELAAHEVEEEQLDHEWDANKATLIPPNEDEA